MPHLKYTPQLLAEAVAAATSMAGVMRHLGLRPAGGTHAHLRRRITKFGIDTTHFTGRSDKHRFPNPRRRSPDEILVVRRPDMKRQAATVLRRALGELGRTYTCEWCGVGASWQGRPLTLHVDHVDGNFSDCRPGNLRFLCPNCHSQTPTYAGRSRRKSEVQPLGPLSEAEKAELLSRVESGELSISDAARLLGCHRRTVHRLRRRLASTGNATTRRRPSIARPAGQIPVAEAPPERISD